MSEVKQGTAPVEFWSSVEYGTFLKGLVREFLRDAKTEAAVPPRSELLATRYPLLATAQQRFAVSESDYRQARGTWARLRMRWRCYVGYPNLLHRRIRREPAPAAMVVCTNTFYAPWVAMRSARKRGIPVVHWMFDLFPDVLVLAGKLKPGSLGERWLRRWVRAMFDGAAANVFLGQRLLAYAEAKFGPIPRAVVIPVGCDAAPFAGMEPRDRRPDRECGNQENGNGGRTADSGNRTTEGNEGRRTFCCSAESTARSASETADGGRQEPTGNRTPDTGVAEGDAARPTVTEEGAPVRVLYCGNFGRMHEVDTVVAALRGGVPNGVRLDFRGNGAGFQTLAAATAELRSCQAGTAQRGGSGTQEIRRGERNGEAVTGDRGAGSEQLRLGGSLPEREWLDAMAAADVALVTMKRGAEGIVMPSKTYSAMAAGQAILAVCPRESDLADLVAAHDCGWVVEPGDVAGLRAVLDSLASRGAEVLTKRRNAWRAARECYDQRVLAERWREVLRGFACRET